MNEQMTLEQTIFAIRKKFTSGNSVPVERATITATEWAAIDAHLNAAKGEAEATDKLTLTAPERIYLQISDDPEHRNEEFSDAEVTWCSESVLECEVEYVRTDLAHPTSPDVVRDAYRYRKFLALMDEADPVSNEASTVRNIIDDSINLGSECLNLYLDAMAAREGGE